MSGLNALDRRVAVARLLEHRRNVVVITGLGSPTYDVAAAGDHDRNFYLWGAMGGAAATGLGLALAQSDTPVAVVTGDGEMLMGMGSFATIAHQNPGNLSIIVLDNGLYGETGGQQSHTNGTVDLATVARGAGIADVRTVTTLAEVNELAERINRTDTKTTVAIVRIGPSEAPRVLPSRDGVYLKTRVRQAFGLPSM